MRLRKPTPSMVVAMTALTVSLGGTSYAAMKITSSDIKNQTIQTKDIAKGGVGKSELEKASVDKIEVRKGAVGASEVRNGTLGPADFKKGALAGGPTGPAGPAGPAGTGRWLLVNATGQIEAQSGGFSVTDAYVTNNNIYLDANEPLNNNGIVATVALDNVNANQSFNGQISASRCQVPGVVECAPPAAKDAQHFVVSPRKADGSATDAGARKRFYVIITGDSTDFTP